jgi:predicted dehydrogenase/threonine dehydrogenase-like Zn-dependent dehydrogenase
MRQILQDLKSGKTLVDDVPAPAVRPEHVRIATAMSLISAGTERSLVDFARGSALSKALQQPERVRLAVQKMQTAGFSATWDAIQSKLEQPMAIGYCNVGRVIEAGVGAQGFSPGDRVVSNGHHADIVVVPKTLCARIPPEVDDESAAFTVIGAIALQGIRLAAPTLGETFVVTGLGLIGLIAVQLLRANGCRVLGIDSDSRRLELAREFGAEVVDLAAGEDPISRAHAFSRGLGIDAVLLTASTKSSEPVSQAARMCRKRGRIVLVGVTGLDLRRSDFYEKEISLQVSCSYGPGRYDPQYEENGRDYPPGFVRWTEQRNFEAVLDMMATGRLSVQPMVTHRFDIGAAAEAYDVLASQQKSLGIIIAYDRPTAASAAYRDATRITLAEASGGKSSRPVIGFIGAGNYGGRVLIRAFHEAGATLHSVVSASGISASHYGRKFSFRHIGSDPQGIMEDPEIDTVCISTRHDSHCRLVREALSAGKNVFVEKPLCLTLEELAAIADDLRKPAAAPREPIIAVGFNRRFAPMVIKMKALLDGMGEPKSLVMTINAGAIPRNHWTQDPDSGGGRILGEACHFIDLMRHLVGAPIDDFDCASLHQPGGAARPDTASLTLRFADGSFGVINYFANGHAALPKERLEVYCGGRVLLLNNFRRLTGYGWRRFSGMRTWHPDKGQKACVAAFVHAVRHNGPPPIPVDQILETSRVAIAAAAL